MKYLLEKDKKKRYLFNSKENLSKSLSFLKKFQSNKKTKYIAKKDFKFNKNSFSVSSIKNRCVFTNRSKSVYRLGRISRIKFRSYSSFGFLTGVTKSSW